MGLQEQVQPGQNKKLIQELENWMDIKGLTQQSRKMFRWVAENFLRFCKETNKPINKQSVLDYISRVSGSSGHKRWRWSILRVCFKVWGIEWFSESEEHMYMPKQSERVNRQVISIEEFMKLYEAADKEWLKIALRIGIETGARRQQIAILLREHFDPKNRTLYIPPVKRSLDGIEILSEELTRMLVSYLSRRKDNSPYLLVDEAGNPLTPEKLNYEFNRIKKMVGLNRKGLNFHSLRRAWATWNYNAGMRELEIMKAGRWKSLHMVTTYVNLQPTEAVIKESTLHPLKRGLRNERA